MCAVVAALLLVDALVRAGWGTMLLLAPWILLGLWAVYVAVFASAVTTDAAGITIQNLLRRTFIPWGAVAGIELTYQLVVAGVDGMRVTCLGGPASARPGRARRAGAADADRRVPAALRDLDRIRRDLEAARSAGAAGGGIHRTWDLPATIALVVLAVAAVVAILLVA